MTQYKQCPVCEEKVQVEVEPVGDVKCLVCQECGITFGPEENAVVEEQEGYEDDTDIEIME